MGCCSLNSKSSPCTRVCGQGAFADRIVYFILPDYKLSGMQVMLPLQASKVLAGLIHGGFSSGGPCLKILQQLQCWLCALCAHVCTSTRYTTCIVLILYLLSSKSCCFLAQGQEAVCITSVTVPNTASYHQRLNQGQVGTALIQRYKITMSLKARTSTATARPPAERRGTAKWQNQCCSIKTALRFLPPTRWRSLTQPRILLCPSAVG